MEYRKLETEEINLHLFKGFNRYQKVIGKTLFHLTCEYAKNSGAKKLYISSYSAEESQAFYKATGCIEAAEYNKELTEAEPCDCQLEYLLQ